MSTYFGPLRFVFYQHATWKYVSLNPTCPAGTSEDSFVVDFSSAFESPVSSFESKLTPTINGLLRAVMQERAIMEDAHRKT